MNGSPLPVRPGSDPFEQLLRLIGPEGPSLSIVDGGANKGRTVARFLEVFPGSTIRAYEPSRHLSRKLVKRFALQTGVLVRAVALGATAGVMTFNVLESQTCSSLLSPTGIREKHAGKPMGLARTESVEVVRLDGEMRTAPDIIKLDLQGYELEALRGAEGLLHGVTAVLCEVSFADLYQDQPLGGEVTGWMRERGFGLEGLYAPWFDGAGELISADALFFRNQVRR